MGKESEKEKKKTWVVQITLKTLSTFGIWVPETAEWISFAALCIWAIAFFTEQWRPRPKKQEKKENTVLNKNTFLSFTQHIQSNWSNSKVHCKS